ncbi:MAG: hypothetical protein CV087_24105, partial [Candidatus Brocadia sp. WS118]
MERPQEQFGSPEEEIAFLRGQIALQERELLERNLEADKSDVETIGKQELRDYVTFTPQSVLQKDFEKPDEIVAESLAQIEGARDKVEEVIDIALEKGVHHALTLLESQKDAYLTDEVHRRLVEYIRSGKELQDFKEGVPPWQVLHMTLFEVALPSQNKNDVSSKHTLLELVGTMQQFLAGMRTVGSAGKSHYVMELAVAEGSNDIVLYVAVPTEYIDLFEKQILSLFPGVRLTEQVHDYNIFVEGGESAVALVDLKKHPIYPIRQSDEFQSDPFLVLINAFSKIEKEGGGAAVQIVVKPEDHLYTKSYEKIIERIEGGMPVKDSIAKSTLGGEMMLTMKEMFKSAAKNKKGEEDRPKEINTRAVELFRTKIRYPVFDTNIRLVVSATTGNRAKQILSEMEATFNQYQNMEGNAFIFNRITGAKPLSKAIKAFSFREFDKKTAMALSEHELATVFHWPESGVG